MAADRKTALITGVTGQDGSYLAEFLLEKGYDVWGIVRTSDSSNRQHIGHLLTGDDDERSRRLHLVMGDLRDSERLLEILDQVRPDELYNLGAQSHIGVSFDEPAYTGDVVGLGTVRLLEGIRKLGLSTRFFEASSSEIFGRANESPQTESTPLFPRNPYGAAKAYAFFATRCDREAHGQFAVNGILYNHESPRRSEAFVTRKVTRAAGRIAAGLQSELLIGNLDVRRDWGFAGDYVAGMWQMLQADRPDDYILATGKTHSLREFCEIAFQHAGMPIEWQGKGINEVGVTADGRTVIRIDPKFFRPVEVASLCGDASKARRELGWTPRVSFEELVRLMGDHDLEHARSEARDSPPDAT